MTQFDLLEDEQDIARNMFMYRIVINVFKKFVHQVGHWLRGGSFYYYFLLRGGAGLKLRRLQIFTNLRLKSVPVYKEVLFEEGSLRVLWFSPVSIIRPVLHTSTTSTTDAI